MNMKEISTAYANTQDPKNNTVMVPITVDGVTKMVDRAKCSIRLRDAKTADGTRVKLGVDRAYIINDDGSYSRIGKVNLTKKEKKHFKKMRKVK